MRRRNRNFKRSRGVNPLAVIGLAILIGSVIYIVRHKDDLSDDKANASYVINSIQDITQEKTQEDNNERTQEELTDISDSVYDRIYTQISEYKTVITIAGVLGTDVEQLENIFQSVCNDHPEFFWLTGSARVSASIIGVVTNYTITLDTRCPISEVPAKVQLFNSMVDEIVIWTENNCENDYEKAKYVHDIIVSNVDYDEEAYAYYMVNPYDGKDFAYTAYGCLVEKKAVCEGYAKAYMLVMNRLGIECGYVTGTATNDQTTGDHGWNYINIDGDYYMVDVTWDDPVGASSDYIGYEYFCISTEQILLNHTIDDSIDVPYCAGGKYSEYVY